MARLVGRLPEGPLDIIGDVHGELEALLHLLARLGVDPERKTAQRPVVFTGDLVDRGPDSVGVVEVIERLVEAGLAHVVLGNHELNLLRGSHKEGNGWYFGDAEDHAQLEHGPVPFSARLARPGEAERIARFFESLPLILVRDDLQVVHACARPDALAHLPEEGSVVALSAEFDREITAELQASGLLAQAQADRAEFAGLRVRAVKPDRHLPAVSLCDSARQTRNPVKLLTSGPESPIEPGTHQFLGGKWRFVRRDDWWQRWQGRATVVGHYWRHRQPGGRGDPFEPYGPQGWAGRVFCVDYSVGRRFAERSRGTTHGFRHALGALRWPERVVQFDDRDEPMVTTGYHQP